MPPDIHVPESQVAGYFAAVVAPVMRRPDHYKPDPVYSEDMPPEMAQHMSVRALERFEASLPKNGDELAFMRPVLLGIATGRGMSVAGVDMDSSRTREALHKSAESANAYADEWRHRARWYQSMSPDATMRRRDSMDEVYKSNPLAKAVLDVGTQTNLTSVTGGQSLGFVSLDTRMARATVRPDSFTLYQALRKSAAFQVVDYWPYIDDTGGALPGSATSGFSNVSSGTLPTNAGIYSLKSVNLTLMLDGRAVTMALMSQNNFVSINEQENANSALTVLSTADWMCYHGNPTLWPNQFGGLGTLIPTSNIFDYQQFYATNATLQGWSTAQALFNMIYEVAGVITSWGRNGRSTHAFMTPATAGSLQSLVTTLLNNITNWTTGAQRGIIVNGDLQGMHTRYGPIQFPMDLIISARDIPAQGQPRSNGTTPSTTTGPTPPTGVVALASGAAYSGTNWGVGAGSPYVSGTSKYFYAVASTDVNMNESNLTWSAVLPASGASGIFATGAVVVSIAGPVAADATAYRVFRTGALGFASGANSPTAVRYIGSVAASGSTTVTFVDANTLLPGGERIYLLDLRDEDSSVDFRYLLPLTRVELFAQNLYMPWAVCSIGAMRLRIPRFNAQIINYIPDNPLWNPLGANV
jgi:hypothetical protein